jgi:tetratricopeptide (TPR) repeat protein
MTARDARRTGGLTLGLVLTATITTVVAVPRSAQTELAAMQGTVTDEDGKPLEGVVFTLTDLTRGRELQIKSDKSGRFYRRGLPAVEYGIKVELAGYQPIEDKVRLNAGIDRRYDFKLARAAPVGAEEFTKGVEAFNAGNLAAAAAAFEAAIQKNPDAPEARVNLALVYLRQSRPADATAQLEHAATLAPDQPAVFFQLGNAYVEARQNDKAIAALERGFAARPDLSDTLAWEATVTLGAVHFAEGRIDQATASFQKALAAKPGAAVPTLGLGKCAFSQGKVPEALDLFKKVATGAPGTPEAAEAEAFIKELEKVKGQAA